MTEECQEGQSFQEIESPCFVQIADTESSIVHYAGNLQIAASFFLGLGLCFTLVLSLLTLSASVSQGICDNSGGA
jgi:hypothetical protein